MPKHRLTVVAGGADVTVEIDGIDELQFEQLRTPWSRCLGQTCQTLQIRYLVDDSKSIEAVAYEMSMDITRALIDALAGQYLMLHAAALANPKTDAAIVMCGPSGAGKTTLAHSLGSRLGYLTDELSIIDSATFNVIPYPKPLSVVRPGQVDKDQIGPDTAGLLPASRAAKVAAVVLIDRRDDGPNAPELHSLDLFTGITELVPHTSSLKALPTPLHVLRDLTDGVRRVQRLSFRPHADLTAIVTELIGSP